MDKVLVVCYSRTGKTNKIGKIIAEQLNGDFEEIIDKKNRDGKLGFIKSGKDAIKKKTTSIEDIKHDPTSYDMIIIGTPVWASTISSGVLTYVETYQKLFKKVAFFYTEASSNETKVFDVLEELCNKKPEATLKIFGQDFKENAYENKTENFCNEIKDI
jgi:flavodoxin